MLLRPTICAAILALTLMLEISTSTQVMHSYAIKRFLVYVESLSSLYALHSVRADFVSYIAILLVVCSY